MKCLQTNRAIKSALLSQIAVEKKEVLAWWHLCFLFLLNASLNKTGTYSELAWTPAAYSLPQSTHLFWNITVALWGIYYDLVGHALPILIR